MDCIVIVLVGGGGCWGFFGMEVSCMMETTHVVVATLMKIIPTINPNRTRVDATRRRLDDDDPLPSSRGSILDPFFCFLGPKKWLQKDRQTRQLKHICFAVFSLALASQPFVSSWNRALLQKFGGYTSGMKDMRV